ncbi:hypothetical protein KAR91_54325, partial [Candidatus Pacearchaeota archaeon]|nr:hypothetical protein [Candidatus Pacearchaeota archaeon]
MSVITDRAQAVMNGLQGAPVPPARAVKVLDGYAYESKPSDRPTVEVDGEQVPIEPDDLTNDQKAQIFLTLVRREVVRPMNRIRQAGN